MTAIVTTGTRLFNAAQIKASFDNLSEDKHYLFIGKSTPWADDASPDTPIDSYATDISVRRDMLAAKRITEADVSTGILRRDWISGQYYDLYRHDYGNVGITGINLIDGTPTSPMSYLETNYYVVTDEFNVYMCLWNNSNSISTVKPTGSSTSSITTADGYVWKYMYTISPADVLKFVSTNFISVRSLGTSPGVSDPYYSQWEVQQAATPGTLNRILVTNQGSGYPTSTSFPITITGDGNSAVAVANTNSSGNVTSITVTTQGAGYSWANISIAGTSGTVAQATAIIAPRGGYGANASVQLGGHYTLISSRLAFDEGAGDFPDVNEYRRIGIIKSPYDYGTTTVATDTTLKATKGVIFSIGITGTFAGDEVVVGNTSGARARVVTYNVDARSINVIQIENDIGNFQVGETVTGQTSAAIGVVASIENPEIATNTGELIYLEHRRPISRQVDQIEDIKIIIES